MRKYVPLVSLLSLVALGACTIVSTDNGDAGGGAGGGGGGGAGGGGGGSADASGDVTASKDGGSDGTTNDGAPCVPDPGNFDIPGNGCDDDGDGIIDNTPTCDSTLMNNGGASDFAKAMGLCQTATGASDPKWGVVSAQFTNGYQLLTLPNDLQHGILSKFGSVVVPREGAMLGILSSGCGQEFDNCNTGDNMEFKGSHTAMQPSQGGAVPAGFPKASGSCTVSSSVNDVIDLQLTIKVPKNAQGLSFDFNFWSGEWPNYVCSNYDDAFIAFLHSAAFNGGTADNFSFDMSGNDVSVNNGFFDRCTPGTTTGCAGGTNTGTSVCPSGTAELAGTGFLDPQQVYCGTTMSSSGGATGWLVSQAPVQPAEIITVDFIIWDTGDAIYDSSVLVDHFQWLAMLTQTGTGRPPP
jgi:hypothetical protein